jgi:hypothetical protein
MPTVRSMLLVVVAGLGLFACDGDDDGDMTGAGITQVRAGTGLTGGGTSAVVDLAVDFNQVAAKTHGHAFSELTGVPAGGSCPAGQKATGFNIVAGTVTCSTLHP